MAHPQPGASWGAPALVDEHLCMVWKEADMPAALALVAVGGYGRCELFPYSDIDLLSLAARTARRGAATKLEALIGGLWDIGLEPGHGVRTIEECVAASPGHDGANQPAGSAARHGQP